MYCEKLQEHFYVEYRKRVKFMQNDEKMEKNKKNLFKLFTYVNKCGIIKPIIIQQR